ncbi:hypothetical protein GCM10007907_23290 [Chitinimonas prasina]|uniref:Uncharacterized protein n=1 Tax=Chitinimonas prasina TaxID=1434937 RepID=A0ABQ5YFR2_9NEIS|nr:hypothetical protein GCM10007907_23290 [Chitinimonas prasina]
MIAVRSLLAPTPMGRHAVLEGVWLGPIISFCLAGQLAAQGIGQAIVVT